MQTHVSAKELDLKYVKRHEIYNMKKKTHVNTYIDNG